ncbi:hypothetical protein [Paraburkholderia sp. BCC1884]|uniref:hypothetical protein n=1 Tax=Paraburkholderia sp. BCC1884 TaxID=2562668 RepID=UPI0016424D3F|nr:hypothetical protein [Paraburkholderia sp. BCC1884]
MQAMDQTLGRPVDAAYSKVVADPMQRMQLEFGQPFGAQYLGQTGQRQTAALEGLRSRFNDATTPQERETLFGQAVTIRHGMQQQIQARLGQAMSQTSQQWAAADKAVYAALDSARSMQSSNTGASDNTIAFSRLSAFAHQTFTSERNAQAFQHLAQQHPDSFRDLRNWFDDASAKTESARSAIQSDPLRRSPDLPSALADFTNPKTDDLHRGNYGVELLDRYREMSRRVVAGEQMAHAASQGGPIKAEYLDAHTPPKPLWQQQTEDVLGRLVIGMIPGVNLLTDYIVPAKSLSPDVRKGIDIMSGVLGGALGEVRKPGLETDALGELKLPHGRSITQGGGASARLAGREGEGAVVVRTKGVAVAAKTRLDLPESYASTPGGKLHADPAHPDVQIDEKGQRYIGDGKHNYAIRYDRDHQTERVYQPDNPTKPGIPVRRNKEGEFERHDEVGLKGGSPGRAFQTRLDQAQGRLERARADRQRAETELTAIRGEIRASQNPREDLLARQRQAQQDRDSAKMTIAIEEGTVASVRREAEYHRQTTQNELSRLLSHREDGRNLERTTQYEINVLETTMRISRNPAADTQRTLHKLNDDLRRIQTANRTLDQRILDTNRELGEIPRA